MTILIDLNAVANVAALFGCAGLLVFWLIVSRKLVGFLFILAGWVTIIVAVRSDHTLVHLAGILTAAVVIAGLIIAGWVTIKAHRLAARVHTHRPLTQQQRARLAEKQGAS